jgi:hypothetical protein
MTSVDDPRQQYLGLTGVLMDADYEFTRFTEALNLIKKTVLGNEKVIFHRREILHAQPPFECLNDPVKRAELDSALLNLMSFAAYKVITVVIDKKRLRDQYSVWQAEPYHYCMMCLMERYVQLLRRTPHKGDVLAESREKRDNKRLAKSYRYTYKHGTSFLGAEVFQRCLPTEIKLARKSENVAGLQLADLIANPCCRDLICRHSGHAMTADFGGKVVEILYRNKYRRSWSGRVEGFGTKWLP